LSNAIFPVGLTIAEENFSFEEMKALEEGWDLQSYELTKGVFYGSLYAVHTPNLQLAIQSYSKAMAFRGAYPQGSILLFMIDSESAIVSHDQKKSPNELIIGYENEPANVLVNASCKTYTLAVETELFFKSFYKRFGVVFSEYTHEHSLIIEKEKLTLFFEGLHAWLKYLSTPELKMTFEYRYEEVEEEILNFVFDYIEFHDKEKVRVKFDVAEIKNYLEKNISESMDIKALSTTFGISERQLHHAFKETYGRTPKKYLQEIRLNAIKHELLASKQQYVKISDVAFKYGFEHMSHFTNAYKKLFGVLPSHTLNK